MIVKIGEREIEMHYSLRMYILFENRLGDSVDYTKILLGGKYTETLNLFYCAVISSMQYHKMELDLEFEEFMDWIDTEEGMSAVPVFCKWYIENLMLQKELQDKIIEKINKKSDKKSDKKGKSLKNVK